MGRALLGLLSLVGSLALTAAEDPPVVASASYSRGACQLRVVSVVQKPSPQGRRRFNVDMVFQFETLPRKADGSTPPLPEGFYLNNDASPLVAAYVVNSKNLARASHSGSAQGKEGVVTINDLEIGDVRQRLQEVDIEVALVRITEWDTLSFQTGLGRSDYFKCGPFELRTMADSRQVRVDAWAYPQFRAEHDAHRARLPLSFLNHTYAMHELKLVDAAGRSPNAAASTVPGAGAVSSTFTGWTAPNTGAGSPAADNEGIAYPVVLTLKLPKRYETERVRFRFEEIPLPMVGAPAR